MEVFFVIPGCPQGKGRPRFRKVGQYVKTYTPKKTVMYENYIKRQYMDQRSGIKLSGPISATIIARFPIPKSASKKVQNIMKSGYVPYTHKSDVDNLAKTVLDALNGLAYDDDRQIVRLLVEKWYGNTPQIFVKLEEMKVKEIGPLKVDMVYEGE